MITLTVVFDNYAKVAGCEAAWGFACLVEGLERTILFDTGSDGQMLLANMRCLGIDPRAVDDVVLSHEHWDHIDGLPAFLEANANVTVHAPDTFGPGVRQRVSDAGAKLVETAGPVLVCGGCGTSGALAGRLPEQALWLAGAGRAAVLTGCAHPGVVNVVRASADAAGAPVHALFGGFHMKDMGSKEILETSVTLNQFGVQVIGPAHCSGEQAVDTMREVFGGGFREMGVGTRVQLS